MWVKWRARLVHQITSGLPIGQGWNVPVRLNDRGLPSRFINTVLIFNRVGSPTFAAPAVARPGVRSWLAAVLHMAHAGTNLTIIFIREDAKPGLKYAKLSRASYERNFKGRLPNWRGLLKVCHSSPREKIVKKNKVIAYPRRVHIRRWDWVVDAQLFCR